jgi:hypothetical protein
VGYQSSDSRSVDARLVVQENLTPSTTRHARNGI